MSSTTCRTRLISDLPATEDAFGPHKRVASTIARLVQSDEEGGKTIALEDGWGSGKSTVVTLLGQELETQESVAVAVFDAWAHQGDPLRRTFLEKLITALEGWVEKDTWEERKRELAGRQKVTETRETPQLTPLAKILAGALMLVPAGVAVASLAGDFEARAKLALAISGGVLAGAPVLFIFSLLLALSLSKRWHWLDEKLREVLGRRPDLLALVTGRTVMETESETYESPDPTSVEFERTFVDLMDEALGDRERRLVLVLDNLDRVDANDALAIWSSMQTFLQRSEHTKPDWLDRLWVLIPYDPGGLLRLWHRAEDTGSEPGGEGLASAFLDKAFQLRFEVPPPVLSDWRAFLNRLLREALPDHNESDFHAVYRVFTTCAIEVGRSPTPRELKLYVNGIGAYHLQHEDEFPLGHLAYYVALRRKRVDLAEELLSGRLPGKEVQSFLPGSIRDSLAALHFNVDVPRAQELLLGEPIAGALSRADAERLRELAQVHPEGFWLVFERSVAAGKVGWDEPTGLSSAARALAESGILEEARSEATDVLAALRRAAMEIDTWSPFSEDTGVGLAALCRLFKPDKDLLSKLFGGISASKIRSDDDTSGVAPATWGKALLTVLSEVRSLVLAEADLSPVTVPSDPEGWIGVCQSLVEGDPTGEFWRLVKPHASSQEISSKLAELVSQGHFSTEHANAVRVTIASQGDGSWADLASAIHQRLQAANTLPPTEVLALFECLWFLRGVDSSVGAYISNLGAQGHALHHLHQARSDDDAEAWCMFVFLRAVPGIDQPAAVGNSQSGYNELQSVLSSPRDELVAEFTDLLARVDELPLLLTVLDASPQSKPFVMACLNVIADRLYAPKLFPPEAVVERWSLMEEAFDSKDLDGLVQRLSKEADLDARIQELQFDAELAGLYASLVRGSAARRAGFRTWCVDGLRAIPQEEWQRQLQEEGPLISLLLSLLDKSVDVRLDIAYQDALAEHGKALIAGSCTVSEFGDRWSELVRTLDEDGQTMLRRRLFDAAAAAGGDITADFFHLYGEEISKEKLLRQYGDAPYRLFTPLLTKRNGVGLRWLADLIQANQDIFREGFERATLEDFKGRIRQEISKEKEASDEAGKVIREIARLLGVRRTPRKGDAAPEPPA